MSDQIAEVKQKSDIVSILSDFIELKKSGRNFKALCPFHSEKTPSFVISPELQIFKCFGCGESGDVISFLEKQEGMEFYEALKYLADRAGIKLTPQKPGFKDDKEKLFELNFYAKHFYSWVLLNHEVGKGALGYLFRNRGLSLETIRTFQLGYSPESSRHLKNFLIDKKRIIPQDLEKAGLCIIRGKDIIDRFRGRVIFPLFDHRNKTIGFAGRLLPKDEKKDLAKYINTPETVIYHKSAVLYGLNITKQEIKKSKEAIIVEGELDLISAWQAGFKNVVAIKGSSLTEDQLRLLSRFTAKIILALDADIAGDEAARRGINAAENLGFEVRVVKLSGFKDPDEAARKDPEKLRSAIKNAKGVWDFLLDSTFERYQGRSGNEYAKISRELVPVIASINDRIVQSHYIALLAQKLGVSIDSVTEEIEKISAKMIVNKAILDIVKPEVKTRSELLEERLLTISFRYDHNYLKDKNVKMLINSPLPKRIYEEYLEYIKKHKDFDPSLFASVLSKELVNGFTDLLLKDIKGLEEKDYNNEKELILRELQILRIKNDLENIATKIKILEPDKETERIKKLEGEFGNLTKKLSELEEKNMRGIIL